MYEKGIVGIPCLDETDRNFAIEKNLAINEILDTQSDCLKNSSELLNSKKKQEASELVRKKLVEISSGGFETSERLNDWCISRQRYWVRTL